MLLRLNKKGQAQDIFVDMLLALGLSIVILIFLIWVGKYFDFSVKEGIEKINSVDVKEDLITILNTKLGSIDLGDKGLGKLILVGVNKETSVMEYLNIVSKVYNENKDLQDDFKRVLIKIRDAFRIIFSNSYKGESESDFEFTPDYTLLYRFIKNENEVFGVRLIHDGFARHPPQMVNDEPTINVFKSHGSEVLKIGNALESKKCYDSGYSKNEYFYRVYGMANIESLNFGGKVKIELHSCIMGRRFKNG